MKRSSKLGLHICKTIRKYDKTSYIDDNLIHEDVGALTWMTISFGTDEDLLLHMFANGSCTLLREVCLHHLVAGGLQARIRSAHILPHKPRQWLGREERVAPYVRVLEDSFPLWQSLGVMRKPVLLRRHHCVMPFDLQCMWVAQRWMQNQNASRV
jgi:hypothetical protein